MKKPIIIGAVIVAVICVICIFSFKNDKQPKSVASEQITVTDGNVTRGDFLSMCVYLYEQLSGKSVEQKETGGVNQSPSVKKAYALGIIDNNDSAVYSGESELTRQEAASLLYVTMITYKLSVRLNDEQTNIILNDCYDNMSIADKNACAFVINSGAVKKQANFYPDKVLTSSEAADWINTVYKVYEQGHEIVFDDNRTVRCGYTVGELIEIMGQPTRIDNSFYECENYIYNTDKLYAIFYVNHGVVRGFFSNFGVKTTTDSYEGLSDTKKLCAYYRIEKDRVKKSTAALRELEQREFFEMLDAYRADSNMGGLTEHTSLTALAVENSKSVSEQGIDLGIPEKVAMVQGTSIEDMYISLMTSPKYKGAVDGTKQEVYAGVGLWYGSIEPCITILIDTQTAVEKQAVPTAEPNTKIDTAVSYSGDAPTLISPLAEDTVGLGAPIVIRLAEKTADSFIARVSNSETGENVVYARVYGDSLTVMPDVLEDGFDYMVTASVEVDGQERFSDISAVRYGNPEEPKIVSPLARAFVDTSGMSIAWKSKYSDFTVSIINDAGEYIASQRVADLTEAMVDGLTDGKYTIEVKAHRKNTNEILSVAQSVFFVQLQNVDIIKTEAKSLSFGKNKYSSLFGGSLVYSSKAEADANMRTVNVPVWKINSNGEKYPTQMGVTVNKAIASQVEEIFTEIFGGDERFPIKSLGGYSWRSTATGSRSQHSYGTCIDINPDENYCIYKSGSHTGKYWKPYEDVYSITPDGDVMRAFKSRGWTWGGEWNSLKDYMHFSYLGG